MQRGAASIGTFHSHEIVDVATDGEFLGAQQGVALFRHRMPVVMKGLNKHLSKPLLKPRIQACRTCVTAIRQRPRE